MGVALGAGGVGAWSMGIVSMRTRLRCACVVTMLGPRGLSLGRWRSPGLPRSLAGGEPIRDPIEPFEDLIKPPHRIIPTRPFSSRLLSDGRYGSN